MIQLQKMQYHILRINQSKNMRKLLLKFNKRIELNNNKKDKMYWSYLRMINFNQLNPVYQKTQHSCLKKILLGNDHISLCRKI